MMRIFFFTTIIILFISCEKDEDEIFIQRVYSNKIELDELKSFGDSVKLTWSKLDTISFMEYLIIRNEEPNSSNEINYYSSNIIARIEDNNKTTYVDVDLPYSPYVEYQVVGVLSSSSYNSNYIYSNTQKLLRPEIVVLDITPLDVLFDKSQNFIYFVEKSGIISIYDYSKDEIVKSIDVQSTIGYCDLKTYNNRVELYVPRNDGWVFIYDAVTLDKIDQIDIGHPSSCVVSNDGKLFVSTDAWANRPLKVFDRSTKTFIDETGDFDWTRFKAVPNSNTELIEITLNVGPTDLDYYSFNESGQVINHQNDRYHGDYPLDADIFEFFPTGDKFITAKEGAIYTKSLTYESRLPKGNLEFSSFAFSNDNKYILCGSSNNKSIEKFTIIDYISQNAYETKGYPFRLFIDDKIICVSLSSSQQSSKLLVEKIEL